MPGVSSVARTARAPASGVLRDEITTDARVRGALASCTALILAAIHLPPLARGTTAADGRGWALALLASLVPPGVGQLWLVVERRRAALDPDQATGDAVPAESSDRHG